MRRGVVLGLALELGAVSLGGCSSDERSPSGPRVATPGTGQAHGGGESGGGADDAGAGGALLGAGGAPLGGERGIAVGGDASGGEPSPPGGGAGEAAGGAGPTDPEPKPDPFPCASDAAVPPTFGAVCSPLIEWAAGAAAEVTTGENASLIGVTPDELTIVWLEPETSEVAYFVADRASIDDTFGEPQRLAGESVLAVSPDGLRLVVLADDQGTLLERIRTDRSQPFGDRSEGDFALLNADAQANGYGFSSCAFSPDGLGLFYTAGGFDERYPLHESRRAQPGAWPVGAAIEACELEAHGGVGRYPTGISTDGKTLFYYDAWRGVARAAWRETSQGPFTWFRDLGDRRAAQVNAACDALYYSASEPATPILVSPAR